MANDPERIDGRTARRDRNRVAVLDAVIELFSEGHLSPGVHEVAARSQVSLRSVYRYFEDVDELISSAIQRQFDLARPLFEIADLGVGALDDRIERLVSGRVVLFAGVRPVFRAASVRAAIDERISLGLLDSRRALREQTMAMFAPELPGDPLANDNHRAVAVDAASNLDMLEYLFGVRAMRAADVSAHLSAALHFILDTGD